MIQLGIIDAIMIQGNESVMMVGMEIDVQWNVMQGMILLVIINVIRVQA